VTARCLKGVSTSRSHIRVDRGPNRKERNMNLKKVLLAMVLLDFTVLTAYAVYQYGYIGFFEMVFANAVSMTLFADLCIALSMVAVWMWRDARDRGLSPVPYLVLTATLGSVGPLVYLIRTAAADLAPVPSRAGLAVG
jgi:hypothetical protein